MRSKWIALVIVVGLLAVTADAQNQILNWEFDEPGALTNIWARYAGANFTGLTAVEGTGLSGRYAMKVDIGPGPFTPLQIIHHRLKLEQGVTYTISFMAKADVARKVTVQLQSRDQSTPSWYTYWREVDLQLTTQPQTFTFQYTHTRATVGGTGDWNKDIDLHFVLAGDGTDLYLDRIWMGAGSPPVTDIEELAKAVDPVPGDGDPDVPHDAVLSWTAGPFAATHNVYFGDKFEDVNNATAANPLTATVKLGLTDTTFAVPGPLDYNEVYYWRVDEVNAPPGSRVFKGDVWSFITETYAYPVTGVIATASSFAANMGPMKTVDNSGLTNGVHSTTDTHMWLSLADPNVTLPAWIRYELPQPLKLQDMHVWNSNQNMESAIGYGAKDVAIEYSLDGIEYTLLREQQFERAPLDGVCAGELIALDGVYAKFIRLTISSNWGGFFQQAGLSEVRFSYIPVKAWEPSPADGQRNVAMDAVLDWRPGRQVVSHNVYFGTDQQAVIDGIAPAATLAKHGYQPDSLQYGQLYYWRVDEVNDAATPNDVPGDVWSFFTAEYRDIDNFESYNEEYENLGCVYQEWIDGQGFTQPVDVPGNGSGALVGHPTWDSTSPHYNRTSVETGTVAPGSGRAMPLYYDNAIAAKKYSEAERTWTTDQDWAADGATELSLWFHGDPNNGSAPLYVAIQDRNNQSAVVSYAAATVVDSWVQWRIPFTDLAAVNLSAVRKMAIGIGVRNSTQAGGSGLVYIDDIRVGHPITPVGLVAHYALENNTDDSSGNGHHGTAVGNPVYVQGPAGLGTGLLFSGNGTQYVNLGTFNPSLMTNKLTVALWARWNGLSTQWQGLVGKRDSWVADNAMWQIEANQTNGTLNFQQPGRSIGFGSALPVAEWTHVAATFDGITARCYINGAMVAQGSFSFAADTLASLQFGCSQINGGNSFNGALDEVRLYDVPLTDAEILQLAGK